MMQASTARNSSNAFRCAMLSNDDVALGMMMWHGTSTRDDDVVMMWQWCGVCVYMMMHGTFTRG